MKKLFISVPMKDRTEENIRKSIEKMHKIAEVCFEQELEVISTYSKHEPPKDDKESLALFIKNIEKLASADYFIGVKGYEYKGCENERNIAESYNVPSCLLPLEMVCPDVEVSSSMGIGLLR